MRVTIIKDDNAVYVDGVCRCIDCSMLDFHALQWYGEWGEIEYLTDFSKYPPQRAPNQLIHDLAPYQSLIDAWTAEANRPPPAAIDIAPVPRIEGGVNVIAT